MKKRFGLIGLIVLLFFSLLSCSGDPVQKGDEAYKKGNYSAALKFYLEAQKNGNQTPDLTEKILRAKLQYGNLLYRKRKVLRVLEARYQEVLDMLPENPSPETLKLLSMTLFELGKGYMNLVPQNEIQKREYLSKTFDYLSLAASYDPENTEAERLLKEFKQKNFEEMLTRGKTYFSRAKKEKNDYFYLSAEYYLKKATDFESTNEEARRLLKKVRKITLKMIDPDLPYPIAVTSWLKKDNQLGVAVTILNNTETPVDIKAEQFVLVDFEGNEYQGSLSDLFEPQLKETLLQPHKEFSGVVVFEVGEKDFNSFEKIIFSPDTKHTAVKYFPN